MKSKKKIVLAYSGGLDTSIILKWLQENYDADVICYTADVGQEIDRKKIISNAKKNNINIPKDKKGAPPFSVDDNLFHTSTEGKLLENPKNSAPEFIFQRTVAPEKAPNKASFVSINFKNGDPYGVNGKKISPAKLLEKLNQLAGKNGIGRVDLVENRFIGIKSRGVYETPGGTLLLHAHRAIESVT